MPNRYKKDKKTNLFDFDLRSRLILLLVVMIFPFIVFSIYQAYHSYNGQVQEKRIDNARDAREIADNIDELVKSTSDLLVAISSSKPARDENFSELKRWFNDISKRYPHYKNIIYVDLDGNIRAAAHTYKKPDGQIIANVKNTAYFKRSLDSNGIAFGDFMYGILSGKPVIHMTQPVFNGKKRLGFVAIAFDLTRLQKRIIKTNISEGSEISVFDQNGTIIARTIDPQKWVGKNFKNSSLMKRVRSGENEITGPAPDGVVRLMTFHPTKEAPWMVSVCFEEAVIRSQALKRLLNQLELFIPLLFVALFGWLWIGRDVDNLYKEARKLSLADPMTSLGSFLKFNQDLTKDIARAKKNMQSLCLLIMDIDNFRLFNEKYGFNMGNQVLSRIASVIKDSLRDTDYAYRHGADEIALILSDTDEIDAIEFAESLQKKISSIEFAAKEGWQSRIGVSFGIANFPLDGKNVDELIDCAKEALFEAKQKNGNTIVSYSQVFMPKRVASKPNG